MASHAASASLNPAPQDAAVAAAAPPPAKKARKQANPQKKAPGVIKPGNKRTVAPKSKSSKPKISWLEKRDRDSLKKRVAKESGAYAALKDRKAHLIRGVIASPYGDGKYMLWIEGRGNDGEFDRKDAFAVNKKISEKYEALFQTMADVDPAHIHYPKNTIRMVSDGLFADKEDATVAWKSVVSVDIQAAAAQEEESDDDEEMDTEEGGDEE